MPRRRPAVEVGVSPRPQGRGCEIVAADAAYNRRSVSSFDPASTRICHRCLVPRRRDDGACSGRCCESRCCGTRMVRRLVVSICANKQNTPDVPNKCPNWSKWARRAGRMCSPPLFPVARRHEICRFLCLPTWLCGKDAV